MWREFWILTLNLVYPDLCGIDWDMTMSYGMCSLPDLQSQPSVLDV